jgi:hypothetical protein
MLRHHIKLYIVGRNVNRHLINHQNQQNMVKRFNKKTTKNQQSI